MSPEQCKGIELSLASDQYSLGVIAYELLAGRPPFSSTGVGDLLVQHLTEQPPHVTEFRRDCPRDLAEAVMQMLEKKPLDRFATIEEALAAAGAVPVLPSHPARVHLRVWAENPIHSRNLADTPISPMVGMRRPPPPAAEAITPAPVAPVADESRTARPRDTAPVRAAFGGRTVWILSALVAVVVMLVAIILHQDLSPPQAAATEGALQVSQLPADGAVFVDGTRVTGGRIALSVGSHRVRIEAPGFAVADTSVQVMAGDTARIIFAAERLPLPSASKRTLVVSGLPAGGTISVDGRRTSSARVELDEGVHSVRLMAPGYSAIETSVQIMAGAVSTVAFPTKRLERPVPPVSGSGVLMLRVTPFAKVFVDGVLKAEDALVVMTLAGGRHVIRFEKAGFTTFEAEVMVPNADTIKTSFTIQPRPP